VLLLLLLSLFWFVDLVPKSASIIPVDTTAPGRHLVLIIAIVLIFLVLLSWLVVVVAVWAQRLPMHSRQDG
jgi:hypothetical protein